jgi:hypothetical protein
VTPYHLCHGGRYIGMRHDGIGFCVSRCGPGRADVGRPPQLVVVTRPKVSSKRLTDPAFTGIGAQTVGGKKPAGP